MHPLLNIADRAARKAGDLIIRALEYRDRLVIEQKQRHDYVTEIDRKAEEIIIDTIRKNYPHHAILSEEQGYSAGEDDIEWIIDPLDGTTNFIHGFPHFAVSIAIRERGRIEHGLIYDPFKQEVFCASRGSGALLNQRRIRVSTTSSFENALLATGFPGRENSHLALQLKLLHAFAYETTDPRRAGAAALDLAYVACGRLDGYWEMDLSIWDIAAGALIVQEAGGLVSDYVGGELHLQLGQIVAGSPKTFKKMLQLMNPIVRDSI